MLIRQSSKTIVWKIHVFLFILFAAFVFSPFSRSTSQSSAATLNVPVVDYPFLTIHYSAGGNIVRLMPGMSKQDINQLLGKGITYRSPAFDYDKHGDLIIAYANDLAIYFSTEGSNASLNGTISDSSTYEDVNEQLGDPSVKKTREYLFKELDGTISQVKPNENVAGIERSSLYRLKFFSSYTDEIYSFSIERGDFKSITDDRIATLNSLIVVPDKPKPFTMWDLSVQTEDGKGRVAIGMSKTTVDRLLGKSSPYEGYGGKWYVYNGAEVFYRNKIVAAIRIELSKDLTEIYRTPRGLGLLTSFESMVNLYGSPTYSSDNIVGYTFFKQKNGLRKVTEHETVDPLTRPPLEQTYVLSFITTDDGSGLIRYILISDSKFAYTTQ